MTWTWTELRGCGKILRYRENKGFIDRIIIIDEDKGKKETEIEYKVTRECVKIVAKTDKLRIEICNPPEDPFFRYPRNYVTTNTLCESVENIKRYIINLVSELL